MVHLDVGLIEDPLDFVGSTAYVWEIDCGLICGGLALGIGDPTAGVFFGLDLTLMVSVELECRCYVLELVLQVFFVADLVCFVGPGFG